MLQRSMTSLVIAAMMFAFTGCKKTSGGDSLAKLEAFEKQMCACKDKPCADAVQADMAKWGSDNMKNAKPDDKPDPEMARKSQDLMTRYTECLTKAAGMAGDMKAGEMKEGEMKAGEMKEGAMKEGEMKEGAMKEGEMKEGAMKDGAMKDGAMKDGAMKDGAMKDGAMKDGAMKDGAMKDGAMKDAKMKDGAMKHDGMKHDGKM